MYGHLNVKICLKVFATYEIQIQAYTCTPKPWSNVPTMETSPKSCSSVVGQRNSGTEINSPFLKAQVVQNQNQLPCPQAPQGTEGGVHCWEMRWAGDPTATPVEAAVHCCLSRTVCGNRMPRVSIMFTTAHSGRKHRGLRSCLYSY